MPLAPREVDRALADLTGWRRVGKTLVRELTMRDFDEALALVDRVGREAVDYQRRPDICVTEFNHVRLKIFNLHHAGLTEAELRLAAKTSATIDEHRAGAATPGRGRDTRAAAAAGRPGSRDRRRAARRSG